MERYTQDMLRQAAEQNQRTEALIKENQALRQENQDMEKRIASLENDIEEITARVAHQETETAKPRAARKFKTAHPCLYVSVIFFAAYIALILITGIILSCLHIHSLPESVIASVIYAYIAAYCIHIAVVCKRLAAQSAKNNRKAPSVLWMIVFILMCALAAIFLIGGTALVYRYEMGWAEHA